MSLQFGYVCVQDERLVSWLSKINSGHCFLEIILNPGGNLLEDAKRHLSSIGLSDIALRQATVCDNGDEPLFEGMSKIYFHIFVKKEWTSCLDQTKVEWVYRNIDFDVMASEEPPKILWLE